MPNWCSNYVQFSGPEANISKLKEAVESAMVREIEQSQGQVLFGIETMYGYFFDTCIVSDAETELSITYETKWSPNLETLGDTCIHFGVDAECEYREVGMEIFGTCNISADGSITDEPIPRAFLDLIEYSIDNDVYLYKPNGLEFECMDEILDTYYPTWKLENK